MKTDATVTELIEAVRDYRAFVNSESERLRPRARPERLHDFEWDRLRREAKELMEKADRRQRESWSLHRILSALEKIEAPS